jgi:ankyrin repeat protein
MRAKLLCGAAGAMALWVCAAPGADTRLVDAVQNGDKASIQSLLRQGADVNATTPDGTTALHWAAQRGDVETAQALLRAGANARAANRYGVTPLTEACASPSGPIAGLLLKSGADPNTVSAEGEPALMTAARAGNLEAVKALVSAGANVNAKDAFRGQTALMWAAGMGRADVVRYLVAHGADLNAHSDVRYEVGKGGGGLAGQHGGTTALLLAARQGETESVKILVEAGADLNQQDVEGSTALLLSAINTYYDLAAWLLDKGADPNVADKGGRTPLYGVVNLHTLDLSDVPARKELDKLSSMDLIKLLVARHADVNARLKRKVDIEDGDPTLNAGTTPFVRAARGADLEVMHFLLDHGADPNITLADKTTAIMIISGIGYLEGKSRGTEADAIEAIKLCLSRGADINAANGRGDTALHGAAYRGANEIAKFLASNGARLDAKNKQGLTAYDFAMGRGVRIAHVSTAEVLKQFMQSPRAQLSGPNPTPGSE